jgi:FtsH-binding integral membrane protein
LNNFFLFLFSQFLYHLKTSMSIFTNAPTFDHLNAFKDFSSWSPNLQAHLVRVYTLLASGMLAAAIGSYVHMNLFPLGGLLSTLATLGFLFLIAMTPAIEQNDGTRISYFAAFSFFQGLSIGPLLSLVYAMDPMIIFSAFGGTTLIFACFTLSALFSQSRSYLYIGGLLSSGLSLMFWLSIVNIFFGSLGIANFQLYLGLIVMSGFVLYDTQLIVEKVKLGSRDYIMHALDLFVDFVGIFVRLLIILAKNTGGEKKEERKRR